IAVGHGRHQPLVLAHDQPLIAVLGDGRKDARLGRARIGGEVLHAGVLQRLEEQHHARARDGLSPGVPRSRLSGAARSRYAGSAYRPASWRRTAAIMDARSDVSMIRPKPRFTDPAAKAALAQCMHALMPCLWAASRILSHVAMCTGSVLSGPGGRPRAKERSEGRAIRATGTTGAEG